jgi:hypothetical protein
MISSLAAQTSCDHHESAGDAQQLLGAARPSAPRQRRSRSTAGLAAAFLALAVLLAHGVHSELDQQSLRPNSTATMLFDMQTGDMQTGDADTLHAVPGMTELHTTNCCSLL